MPDVKTTRDTAPFEVVQGDPMPFTVMKPTWAWSCSECGLLGLGHTSENAAWADASRHYFTQHE